MAEDRLQRRQRMGLRQVWPVTQQGQDHLHPDERNGDRSLKRTEALPGIISWQGFFLVYTFFLVIGAWQDYNDEYILNECSGW